MAVATHGKQSQSIWRFGMALALSGRSPLEHRRRFINRIVCVNRRRTSEPLQSGDVGVLIRVRPEENENRDAGDRNVEPDGEGYTRDSAMDGEAPG
jgi:hypothetical protein